MNRLTLRRITSLLLCFAVAFAALPPLDAAAYPLYTVEVISGGYDAVGDGDYAEGDIVMLEAGTPTNAGQSFIRWSLHGDGITETGDADFFDNRFDENTFFEMPAESITVWAIFGITTLTVTVKGGGAGADDDIFLGGTDFWEGDLVIIRAGPAPPEMKFGHWVVVSGTPIIHEVLNFQTWFFMPDHPVTIMAVFVPTCYAVTVVSDGVSPSGTGRYYEDDVVSIDAGTPPPLQRFSHWTTSSPGVVFADENSAATTFVMPKNDVTVTAVFIPNMFTVIVNSDGTGSGASTFSGGTDFWEGDEVTINAGTPPPGMVFSHWILTSGSPALDNVSNSPTFFEMPANNVVVTAVFTPILYNVNVISAGTGSSGSGNYAMGTIVSIDAGTRPPLQVFSHWETATPGVVFADVNSSATTFVMPMSSVVVTAVFVSSTNTVTVNSVGTNATGSGSYHTEGDTVQINAGVPPAGMRFSHWETASTGVAFANANNAVTTFIMPNNAVTVTAVFAWIPYSVIVHSSGTNSSPNPRFFTMGQLVEINAGTPPAGQRFSHWIADDGGDIDFFNVANSVTTFIMPARNVEVTAVFAPIFYIVSINSEHDNSGFTGGGYYVQGSTVQIGAGEPPQGMRFSHWSTSSPGVTFANEFSANTSFIMPGNNVIITAHFTMYTVTVISRGLPDSPQVFTFRQGDTVSINAGNAPGWRFVTWTSDVSGVTFGNPLNAATTFPMPASDVVVTAVFDQIRYRVTTNSPAPNSSQEVRFFVPGELVTVDAGSLEGWRFLGWTSMGMTLDNTGNPVTTFIMPAHDVVATASFELEHYIVTVRSEGSGAFGGGLDFIIGTEVRINAGVPPTGMRFLRWEGQAADIALLADRFSAVTLFNMPGRHVEVTAVFGWVPYTVGVISAGTGSSGSGTYIFGDTVPINAGTPPEGERFSHWVADCPLVVFGNANSTATTFSMPPNNVTIEAVFVHIPYIVTVMSEGLGSSGGGTNFARGSLVEIDAGIPPEGMRFREWITADEGVTFADAAGSPTTFIMPARNVVVTAVFELIPNFFDVTVISDGSGSSGSGSHAEDTAVSISAGIPPEGMRFREWIAEEAAGVVFADASSPDTTFIMPSNDVTVTAVFEIMMYIVTVNSAGVGSTGGGVLFTAGSVIEISAGAAPEGMRFVNWTTESEGVVFTNALNPLTTFTMPARDVIVTANFEFLPPTVSSVVISPGAVTVNRGTTQQFSAVVVGMNNPQQNVTWQVTGGGTGTAISAAGILAVSSAETAQTLMITATSVSDSTIFGTATVTISTIVPPTDSRVLMSVRQPGAVRNLPNGTGKTSTALGLPASVVIVTNEGIVAAEAVWFVDTSEYNPNVTNRQEFIVNGGAVLPGNVANPNGISLSLNISVTVNARGAGGSSGGGSSGGGNNNIDDDDYYIITFNANGGTVTTSSRRTNSSGRLASLPTPSRTGYSFDGWYTARTGGRLVTTSTIFTDDTTIFARWTLRDSDDDDIVIQAGTGNIIVNIPRVVIDEIHENIPVHQLNVHVAGSFIIRAGASRAGQNAVLVRYDENAGRLVFVSGERLNSSGNATFTVDTTGDYLVLIRRTGDITGTGEVGTNDALELLRHIAGVTELNCIQLYIANGRTGSVETSDALNILRLVAGIINSI
jgi:uncharacterized repeat protein (TIGR02543 family)